MLSSCVTSGEPCTSLSLLCSEEKKDVETAGEQHLQRAWPVVSVNTRLLLS